VKLSLDILDLLIDRYSEEQLFRNGNTILHAIAYSLEFLCEGFCTDKWLSFLRKIVDRFPVEILSMNIIGGNTVHDFVKDDSWHDKKWMKEVLEILKPR
jgi:hypothetical protein